MTKEERERLLKEKLVQMRQYEKALYDKGLEYIAGVDEVGRGPLAGPVVAAAVVLPGDFDVLGVDDSKKLTAKKREELYEIIKEKAVAYGIGQAEHDVIDKINILQATKKAMIDAVVNANNMLTEKGLPKIQHILFDAITIEGAKTPQTAIVKGDSKSISIAAASIMAKVTRDRQMVKYHEEYPHYCFDTNKGYGTKAHYEGLKEYGVCPIHRKTFLKNFQG